MAGLSTAVHAQTVTYKPYIQPGDNSSFGPSDQMVIAWQSNERTPNSSAYSVQFGLTEAYGNTAVVTGRVVDNYLSADPALPVPPSAPGPRVNYVAVLAGLNYDTTYYYKVTGPGFAGDGFTSFFHTRTKGENFSFLVEGDEGFFPAAAGSPARIVNYAARIANTMFQVDKVAITGLDTRLPRPDLAVNTGDNVYNRGFHEKAGCCQESRPTSK